MEVKNKITKFNTNIFEQFDKKWALLSAGTKDDHNAMTISWGSMGTLWNLPIITAYVKPLRVTHKFMLDKDYFTVSFYPEEMRDALEKMGTISKREHPDKDIVAGLTVRDLGKAVTYEGAEITFLCKKIYFQDMVTAHMPPEIVKAFYSPEEPHTLFIGAIMDVITK